MTSQSASSSSLVDQRDGTGLPSPSECVEESVVEGHISKLRKKLRMRLGYDPIEAKRMAGYTFVG